MLHKHHRDCCCLCEDPDCVSSLRIHWCLDTKPYVAALPDAAYAGPSEVFLYMKGSAQGCTKIYEYDPGGGAIDVNTEGFALDSSNPSGPLEKTISLSATNDLSTGSAEIKEYVYELTEAVDTDYVTIGEGVGICTGAEANYQTKYTVIMHRTRALPAGTTFTYEVQEVSIIQENTSGITNAIGDGSGTMTLNMYDDYGDGWNGAECSIWINGIEVHTGITLYGYYTHDTFDFAVNTGDLVEVIFTSNGSYPYEVSADLEMNSVTLDSFASGISDLVAEGVILSTTVAGVPRTADITTHLNTDPFLHTGTSETHIDTEDCVQCPEVILEPLSYQIANPDSMGNSPDYEYIFNPEYWQTQRSTLVLGAVINAGRIATTSYRKWRGVIHVKDDLATPAFSETSWGVVYPQTGPNADGCDRKTATWPMIDPIDVATSWDSPLDRRLGYSWQPTFTSYTPDPPPCLAGIYSISIATENVTYQSGCISSVDSGISGGTLVQTLGGEQVIDTTVVNTEYASTHTAHELIQFVNIAECSSDASGDETIADLNWVSSLCSTDSGTGTVQDAHSTGSFALWAYDDSLAVPATPVDATYVEAIEYMTLGYGIQVLNMTGGGIEIEISQGGAANTWYHGLTPGSLIDVDTVFQVVSFGPSFCTGLGLFCNVGDPGWQTALVDNMDVTL